MAIQLKLLVIIVFLLIGDTTWAEDNASRFDGNFPSKKIRELWQVCSYTFQTKHPQIPQPLRWEVCDCYTDVIRETLSPKEVDKLNFIKTKDLSMKLINECNGKLNNKPPIIT